jgi:hypothetical protein
MTMSAVFFHREAAAAHAANLPWRDVVIEQLLAAARDGMRIEIQKGREQRISTAAQFDRFQAGEEAALLFVAQAVKQQNGGFEFIGGHGECGRIGDQRDGLRSAPGSDLILRRSRIRSGVQEPSADLDAAHPTLLYEIVQRILHGDVEPVGEFIGEPALHRVGDPCRQRVHERAMAGEPHRLMGPQAVVVKACDLAQRIEPPPVRVAGQIAERRATRPRTSRGTSWTG